jgi:hypothetical protein
MTGAVVCVPCGLRCLLHMSFDMGTGFLLAFLAGNVSGSGTWRLGHLGESPCCRHQRVGAYTPLSPPHKHPFLAQTKTAFMLHTDTE